MDDGWLFIAYVKKDGLPEVEFIFVNPDRKSVV